MKENFIAKKILEDATQAAGLQIKEAEVFAMDKLRSAQKQFGQDKLVAIEKAKSKIAETIEHKKSSDEAENRKRRLLEKQSIIDEVFTLAKEDLLKNKARYNSLMSALAKKHKKPEDTVKKIDGGIIIENPKYELRITIDELLQSIRESHTSEIAKIIWDE